MPKRTPEQIADRYVRNANNAIGDWAQGIDNVDVAPGIKAAAKKDKWLAGINRAATEGTWETNVASVSLEDWKGITKRKGESRYGQGVAEAHGKQREFHEQLQNFRVGLDSKLASMPDTTPQDRENKMLTNMREMRKFRRRRNR